MSDDVHVGWVQTADAYVSAPDGSGNVVLFVDVWANVFLYSPLHMLAQYRRVGDVHWIPMSGSFDITTNTKHWFSETVEHGAYEVRGAAFHGTIWFYGAILTLEGTDVHEGTDPIVNTGTAVWASATTATVKAHGSPGTTAGTGDMYVQYRLVGAGSWSETTKETITVFTTKSFSITGLDETVETEARAALDYVSGVDTLTVYGDTVTITDGFGGVECETKPSGAGTSGDPYIITDICELSWMRNDLTAYYELGNNIDTTLTRFWNWSGSYYEGWEPIGFGTSLGEYFEGHFDGKGFEIRDLYINRPTGIEWNGLFGVIKYAVVQNLTLRSPIVVGNARLSSLSAQTEDSTISHIHVLGGSVSGVGHTYGGISGSIVGGSHHDCSFTGSIYASGDPDPFAKSVGGIAAGAQDHAQLLRCSVNAQITVYGGKTYSIGGLVGSFGHGSVSQCYSEGAIYAESATPGSLALRIGGLVGRAYPDILNSYSRMSIFAPNSGSIYAAGAVGSLEGYTPITNSYSTGAVTGRADRVKGLIAHKDHTASVNDCFWDIQTSGLTASEGGTGKTTAQMKTQSTFVNWDFDDIWGIDPSINDGYPYLLHLIPTKPLPTFTLAGFLWVEGVTLCYLDNDGNKKVLTGVAPTL